MDVQLLSSHFVGHSARELESIGVLVEEDGHRALERGDTRDEGLVQDQRLEFGSSLRSDERAEGLDGGLISVYSGVLMRVEDYDSTDLLLHLSCQLGARDQTERKFGDGRSVGHLREDLRQIALLSEVDHASERCALQERVKRRLIGNRDDCGLSLLRNPLLQTLRVTLSSII